MKTIAVSDLGEYYYGDYKEPFVQLEGAQPGYPRGALLVAKDGSGKLLCAYCRDESKPTGQRGRTFHNLGNHARLTHGLRAADYKREVGLLQKSALVSERGRQMSIATALRRGPRGGLPPSPRGVFGHGVADRGDVFTGKRAPEYQNKTGQCFAQMIAAARSVSVSGRPVTFSALRKVGIHERAVRRYVWSIERLRQLVGSAEPGRQVHMTPDVMLLGLRSLAVELGRTPTGSDLRRFGLPHQRTYQNHFGTYAAACARAGLPANLPVARPIAADESLAIVASYAATGSIGIVASRTSIGPERVKRCLASFGISPLPTNHRLRRPQMEFAATLARRLAGWPEGMSV